MSNSEINDNTPQTVKKIAAQLWRVGWAGFWLQLALAVVSTLIFLFAAPSAMMGVSNPGTGGSLIFSLVGLCLLYISTFWSFRYVVTSRKLKNPDNRPKRVDTIKLVQWGLTSSIAGMGASVMGAESIAGTLLGKSLSSMSLGLFNPEAFRNIIQPLDIFIVLANTHTITAHFIGIVSALWLLTKLNKQG